MPAIKTSVKLDQEESAINPNSIHRLIGGIHRVHWAEILNRLNVHCFHSKPKKRNHRISLQVRYYEQGHWARHYDAWKVFATPLPPGNYQMFLRQPTGILITSSGSAAPA